MTNEDKNKSFFLKNIDRGQNAGILTIDEDTNKIIYKASRAVKTAGKNSY